jgi:hypothetical protein
MDACESGNIEAVRTMLMHDANLIGVVTKNGTPLHAAISGVAPLETA